MYLMEVKKHSMNFDSIESVQKDNYFRDYKLLIENVLDLINKFGEEPEGITSGQMTDILGIRPNSVRSVLADLINQTNAKKYFNRKRKRQFHYYKVCDFNPRDAYYDIKNSDYEKVTLNRIGLKNSTCPEKLICNMELFPNVMNILKKNKKGWLSVCKIAKELGVDTSEGKKTIQSELRRCLKCTIKFVEESLDGEYRLVYKYKKHTIDDLKEIAHKSFPQDKPYKISKHKIQSVNNISSMVVNQ